MKLDEAKIQYTLFQVLNERGQPYIIPNVSWSWSRWEADSISITKSGYVHEYEIKVTLSDFRHDFLKRKHLTFQRRYAATRGVPNYFWYVAPEKAVPICIPDYAGLIIVEPLNKMELTPELVWVKKAKKIHNEKIRESEIIKILRTLMFKYWRVANNLDNLKIQREIFSRDRG